MALGLWVAGGVIVRNCDITNAYIGIKIHDRNEGGIFANANPSDLEPWNVVPLSGFGKTGNHLFERNRIHGNSWGIFFESVWDLGSVIRYNLIYENHHPSEAFAQQVKNMTTDGQHQTGGAFWTKDQWLSPVAIYNNTFWHNYLLFVGHWKPGPQHLIFNNIYAEPNQYWGSNSAFQNPWQKIDNKYPFRMKHCVYAAQAQAPTQYYVGIMNDFQLAQTNGPIPQGTLITTPFPAEADIRWLETKFKSTNETSPDFLVPDWDDSLVAKYIVDKGWPAAGIRDADGSMADLGAIAKGGAYRDLGMLTPVSSVVINGTKATVSFNFSVLSGAFSSPRIAYVRFIKNLPIATNATFGNNFRALTASDIYEVPVPTTPICEGSNTLTFTIPQQAPTELYAFFEIIVEGTGANGQPVQTTVGFMPYRKLDYTFRVTVMNLRGDTITEVRAGEQVVLAIEALKADRSRFEEPIREIDVSLASGAVLRDENGNAFAVPDGVDGIIKRTCVFTKVPPGGAEEIVSVAGIWRSTSDKTNVLPFYGASDGITVRPGPPQKLLFQEPPSNSLVSAPTVIDPGVNYNGTIQVYDRYDNKVDQPVNITLFVQ